MLGGDGKKRQERIDRWGQLLLFIATLGAVFVARQGPVMTNMASLLRITATVGMELVGTYSQVNVTIFQVKKRFIT